MRYPNAANGLRLMFVGQILMIVGVLLVWVPIVGGLLLIAAPFVELVGIYRAGEDDDNYRVALGFAVLSVVINLISGFLSEGLLSSIVDVASEVVGLLMVFCVCSTTSNLLHSIGQEALSQRGGTVAKIYTACTAVSIVCRVLSVVPLINIAAGLASAVAGIVQIVGYVMYLLFLKDSSRAL